MTGFVAPLIALSLATASAAFAGAVVQPPDESRVIGQTLPHVAFEDDAGRARDLSRFEGQPLIVLPIYTQCHGACSQLAMNLKRAVARADLDLRTYQVFLFSFDEADTAEDLRQFRARLRLPAAWTLGHARSEQIRRLTSALDYHFARDGHEWIHPEVAAVVGSNLAVSAILRGPAFSEQQIVEALTGAKTLTNWKLRFGPYIFAIATMTLILSAIMISALLGNVQRFPPKNW